MSNTWKFDVRHKLFMLILLLLVAPVLCGLDGMFDGGWQAGTAVDFDDDLLPEFFQSVHRVTLHGPVISRTATLLTPHSSLPFHPPV
jgi:hypothetical protein